MLSATEITKRKQIVQDFHEFKSEIMSLLGMNPMQIEMLDTQSILKSVLCSKIEIIDGKEIRTLMPKA